MKQLIILLLCSSIYFSTSAQGDARAKSWTVGTEKGYAQIDGEVTPGSGFGLGVFGERSFSNFLAARLYLGMGDARGLDQTTSNNWLNHPVWNGSVDPAVDYDVVKPEAIYANFKTTYKEASLQAIFTFTQLPVFKNHSPFDGYLTGGVGMMGYTSMVDALDENGLTYDFDSVAVMPAFTGAETSANLNIILDGEYETQSSLETQVALLFQFGAGFKWQVRKNIALSLAHRVSITDRDDLDSYRWDQNNAENGINDVHHFSTIGLSFKLPKRKKQKTPKKPPQLTEPETQPMPDPEPASEPEPEPEPEPIIQPERSVEVVTLTADEEEVVRKAFENTEFETDKAVIRQASFISLNELATLLSEHPGWKLRITGHTDNTGTPEWNMDLSRRRVESVMDYLSKRDIDAQRIIESWHGEEQPIDDNSTSQGRQRNRRVSYEIVE